MNNRCKFLLLFLSTALLIYPRAAFPDTHSPYEYNITNEIIILSGGLGLLLVHHYINDRHPVLDEDDISRMSRSDVNRFDRNATYNWSPEHDRLSDHTRNILSLSPLIFLLSSDIRSDYLLIGLMYIETFLITKGITSCVKAYVGRARPYVYNDDVDIKEKTSREALRSFPSGHTSTAFSGAVFFSMVFNDYYPDTRWKYPVWVSSLALAATTGFLRYKAGKHYPTDILTGAFIGSVSAYSIVNIHRKKQEGISIIPLIDHGYTGLNISLRL